MQEPQANRRSGVGVPREYGGAYLTIQEVADLARCEHKSVRRAINSGRLQAFRGPKRFLVREDHARAWIEGSPVLPNDQTSRSMPRRSPLRPANRGSVAALKDYAVKEGRL